MEQITTIREAIKGEALTEGVKSALKDLEKVLKDASTNESKIEDLQNQFDSQKLELSNSLRDTMKYKDLQKKAEGHLKDRDGELEEMKTKYTDFDQLKADNENLQSLKVERDNKIRSDYQAEIESLKDKEPFAKIKDKIVLPTDEKKIDDFTIEELTTSSQKLAEYKSLGLFESVDSRGAADTKVKEETQTNKILDGVFGKLKR